MTEWYEEFFDGLYQRVLAGRLHPRIDSDDVSQFKRLLKVRKGQRVLDVPCGMGRITLPLADAGLRMTGIDLSAKAIARARREAKRAGLDIRYVCSDMRDIEFEEEFDAALNWGGSFGYLRGNGNLAHCKAVFRALKPGGRFLVEADNKSRFLAQFPRRADSAPFGMTIERRLRWDGRSDRVHAVWTMTRGRKKEQHRMSVRLYNGTEIRALLRRAGFREIELFSHLYCGRFTRHSRAWIAVGRKPS